MKSKYFKAHELVDRETYKKYGERSFRFIDPRLIETIDQLKEDFSNGTITINNYLWKGDRANSGLRLPGSEYHSTYSQHSFGRAVDMIFSRYSTKRVRKHILENLDKYPHVKGLEIASWLHIDTRNEDSIVIFDKANKLYTIEEALKAN